MTAELVEISSCKRNLTVELPAEELQQEIDALSREYARSAKVPGFRPGKVPLKVIKQRFGNDLRQDATSKIIERSWKHAIEEHKLSPLVQPEVKDLENKPDQPLKFTLAFEVMPEVEVKDYKDIAVTQASADITDERVAQAMENLREQHAQFIPVDEGEAADGHIVTITVDGQFEGVSKPTHEENITLVLGHPQTNEEFTKNLLGTRQDETRSFDVDYPEDYHRKDFAGKKVHYTVVVKEIKEKRLPEINDDFAKDIGQESVEALRDRVRNDLVTQATQVAEKKAREAALQTIMDSQKLEVPDCLVQQELESNINRMAARLAMQGVDLQNTKINWQKIFEEERPNAEKIVRQSIFLDAIARQEKLEILDDELQKELEKLAEGSGKSAAVLKAQLEKEERIEGFKQHLLENKAFDFIYRNAKITME